MWAIVAQPDQMGEGTSQVAHYDGRSWKLVPTPKIVGAYGEGPKLVAVSARSSREVLVAGTLEMDVNGEAKAHPIVLRWDGKAWRRFDGPGKHGGVASILPDGKGGFWTTLGAGLGCPVYHVTGGRWLPTPLPKVKGKWVAARDLFTIPGSPSLWSTGLTEWGAYPATNGLILKYSR